MIPVKVTLLRHIICKLLISPLAIEIQVIDRCLFSRGPSDGGELLCLGRICIVVRGKCGVPERTLGCMVKDQVLGDKFIYSTLDVEGSVMDL